MTTIATDGKSMAADGRVTSCDMIFSEELVKIHRLADGRLVGIAGSGYFHEPFLKWLEEGGEKPKLSDNFEGLVLHPDGTACTYDENCYRLPESLPTASGSGRPFALAAMDLGFSPEEAVKAAIRRDTQSGGKITVLHLKPALEVVDAA